MTPWRVGILWAMVLSGVLAAKTRGGELASAGPLKVGANLSGTVGFDVSRPGTELVSPEDLFDQPGIRKVFLSFFQTTCAPCLVELSELHAQRQSLKARGVAVFLVAVQEEPSVVRKFLADRGYVFPTLVDRFDAEFSRRSGVFDESEQRRLPTSLLLGRSKSGLQVEAIWQGGGTDMVAKILEKVKG